MSNHDSRPPTARRRPPGLDAPLKVLFREHARELIGLLGEPGASVRAARVLELNTLTRRLDCVLEVEQAGRVHQRLVEFETRLRRGALERFLLYAAQLMAQSRQPVLTTIIALQPPAPPGDRLILRVRVGGQTVNRWRFDLLRLWELDAQAALARGTPGHLALVPLMRGGRDLATIAAASARLASSDPPHGLSEAHTALFMLAGRYYTVAELAQILGRDKLMQSSLWQEALAEGRQEGRQEGLRRGRRQGRLRTARALCRALVARYHPTFVEQAGPAIDACDDLTLLEHWSLETPAATPAAFARLLGLTR